MQKIHFEVYNSTAKKVIKETLNLSYFSLNETEDCFHILIIYCNQYQCEITVMSHIIVK